MKHHDSISQAEQKLATTLKQLAQWKLPATPINYALAYEYISEKNTPLITKIDQHIFNQQYLDNFTIEELYHEFVLGQSDFRYSIFDDVADITSQVKESCLTSTVQSKQFVEQVDTAITDIEQGDARKQEESIQRLKAASQQFMAKQRQLTEQLLQSQQQAKVLQTELAEARKEIYLDPITRLYNKKALHKHFEAWTTNDPNKQLAAVVVNVDHFKEFNEKFGSLIGDVILSKIANKVSNYVGESGLPVRLGNEEFLILMPDVEASVASEIAEKIRQGVEKLRFISSKSGIRLPKMTISLGVSEYQRRDSLSSFVKRTKQALLSAQVSGRNQVAVV
ncbi:GGDEF domain-containing protein [Thalassotalea euphylliae]|uniref:GGDEF domain-containing protein n=1 Tax=Thalassotalea euphylliae TaxID=1655234 RepID=UPI00363075F6